MCRGGEGVVLHCCTVWVAACRGNIAVWGGGMSDFWSCLMMYLGMEMSGIHFL
jgi:hypothetical protein